MIPSRRNFLTGLALFAVQRIAPAAAGEAETAELLLSVLADRDRAAQLGQIWLQQATDLPEAPALARRLLEKLRHRGWDGSGDQDAIRATLAAATKADYAAGRTVTVEGWELARTQIELCALAYLDGTSNR
jgi:hypothetical protein